MKTPKVKVPAKAKTDPTDNGKGFKKVPKGGEKGTTKFVPPWAKKNSKGTNSAASKASKK